MAALDALAGDSSLGALLRPRLEDDLGEGNRCGEAMMNCRCQQNIQGKVEGTRRLWASVSKKGSMTVRSLGDLDSLILLVPTGAGRRRQVGGLLCFTPRGQNNVRKAKEQGQTARRTDAKEQVARV